MYYNLARAPTSRAQGINVPSDGISASYNIELSLDSLDIHNGFK
jgi:hypothetical protein